MQYNLQAHLCKALKIKFLIKRSNKDIFYTDFLDHDI